MPTIVVPSQYGPTIVAAAQQYGIQDPGVLASLLYTESRFDPNAISSAGAVGIAQILPSTATQLGVNPYDPTESIYGAAQYLSQLGYSSNPALALAEYNVGPNASPSVLANQGANYAQTVLTGAENVTGLPGQAPGGPGLASGTGGSYLSSDFSNYTPGTAGGPATGDTAFTDAQAAQQAQSGSPGLWDSIVGLFGGGTNAIPQAQTTQVQIPQGSVYDLGLPQATGAAGQDISSGITSGLSNIGGSVYNAITSLESEAASLFQRGAIIVLAVVLIIVAFFYMMSSEKRQALLNTVKA